jgi:RNA polymerase sigma-70 factor (sigma-E family)
VTERSPGDFEEYVRLNSGKLLRFAIWMTGNWEDAQDAVQEALAKAYLVWARIEQPDAYVHRMLINLIRRSYRKRHRELLVADPPEDGAADPNLESITARTVLAAALRSLPRRQRAVVVLRYCLDLPVADVASLLHCSEGTVKSQSSKALAKLGSDPALSEMG